MVTLSAVVKLIVGDDVAHPLGAARVVPHPLTAERPTARRSVKSAFMWLRSLVYGCSVDRE
jgi:hypothetical protein